MPAPVGPAVEAGDRTVRGVETRHEPIGAARRPGLQHAELLDAALLGRLERRSAGAQAGRNPISLDQSLRSCAGGSVSRSGRIRRADCAARTWRARWRRLRPATAGSDRPEGPPAPARCARQRQGNTRQRAAPAFRNDDRVAFVEEAVRIGQIAGDLRRVRRSPSSNRHTEPEAFFSIRSRFQSAGPWAAEPLATSSEPSARARAP